MAVAIKVTTGARPTKPTAISPEDIWNLVEDCWCQNADERPTTAGILQRLRRRIGKTIAQSPPDWDDTYSAKFRRSVQEWPLLPSIAQIQRRIPSNPMDADDAFLVALENLELVSDITRFTSMAILMQIRPTLLPSIVMTFPGTIVSPSSGPKKQHPQHANRLLYRLLLQVQQSL